MVETEKISESDNILQDDFVCTDFLTIEYQNHSDNQNSDNESDSKQENKIVDFRNIYQQELSRNQSHKENKDSDCHQQSGSDDSDDHDYIPNQVSAFKFSGGQFNTIRTNPSSKRLFQCEFCNKSFTRLNIHLFYLPVWSD